MSLNLQTGVIKARSNSRGRFIALGAVFSLLLVATDMVLSVSRDSDGWEQKLDRIVWVGYSPPTADPTKGIEATPDAIRTDLAALRKAGFTGLVTYSSSGVLGSELPGLAQEQGFEGIIMGIWDPASPKEISAAKASAKAPIVLGFCVGNEGLGRRYQLSVLSAAIQDIRKATGKPVTTTEIVEQYQDEDLLRVGDWVFPNAHPYFHNQLDPNAAVQWTRGAYDDLRRRSDRFVLLKEVGLPTNGDPQGRLTESLQERYYQELAKTDVRFVYFEGFDQPWKTHLPVEPYWGIFRADRTPKRLGQRLIGQKVPTRTAASLYIYEDVDSPNNHYKPTGYMGDTGDIQIDDAFEGNPHSGKTSIRITYQAKGKGPNECSYSPPCKWAGLYWQEPPNNWGRDELKKGKGLDLSSYKRLVFWARADSECSIEFKVGGINEPYGDSLKYPRSKRARLGRNWQEFEIDLTEADLKHIIGGFCWVTTWDANPKGITFYLDDIRFEK
jgi:exo-beta-1,3-glucanase (GH17 family)